MAGCNHHENIIHRMVVVESRLNRLEMGIFSTMIGCIGLLATLLYTVWDLPSQIRTDIRADRYKHEAP